MSQSLYGPKYLLDNMTPFMIYLMLQEFTAAA